MPVAFPHEQAHIITRLSQHTSSEGLYFQRRHPSQDGVNTTHARASTGAHIIGSRRTNQRHSAAALLQGVDAVTVGTAI